MTVCPARRLTSALQGGFLLRILPSGWSKEPCSAPYNSHNPGPQGQNTLNKNGLCLLTNFSVRCHVPTLLLFRIVFSTSCFVFQEQLPMKRLVEAQIVPSFAGFSSMMGWVIQLCHPLGPLGIGKFYGLREVI